MSKGLTETSPLKWLLMTSKSHFFSPDTTHGIHRDQWQTRHWALFFHYLKSAHHTVWTKLWSLLPEVTWGQGLAVFFGRIFFLVLLRLRHRHFTNSSPQPGGMADTRIATTPGDNNYGYLVKVHLCTTFPPTIRDRQAKGLAQVSVCSGRAEQTRVVLTLFYF